MYCEGIIIGKNIFNLDNFIYQDIDGNEIRKIVFRPYGQSKYFEYLPNGVLVKTIESKTLFRTQLIDYTNIYYNKMITCDSRYGIINEKNIPKLIHPGACIIS